MHGRVAGLLDGIRRLTAGAYGLPGDPRATGAVRSAFRGHGKHADEGAWPSMQIDRRGRAVMRSAEADQLLESPGGNTRKSGDVNCMPPTSSSRTRCGLSTSKSNPFGSDNRIVARAPNGTTKPCGPE